MNSLRGKESTISVGKKREKKKERYVVKFLRRTERKRQKI